VSDESNIYPEIALQSRPAWVAIAYEFKVNINTTRRRCGSLQGSEGLYIVGLV